jgi:hypothetical protein
MVANILVTSAWDVHGVIPQNFVAIFPNCGKLKPYCESSFFILRLAMVLPMVVLHRRVPLIQALS